MAYVNRDNRCMLYKCRWSSDEANRIVPELIRVLSDEDHLLVDESLRALFVIGTPAVAAACHVVPLISSSFPITRQLAVLALGQIAHKRPEICVEPMTKALDRDDVSQNALRILAFLGGKATIALPAIVEKYRSEDAKTRKMVVTAVAAIDAYSEMVRQLFANAKTDCSKLVRAAADKALEWSQP